MIKNISFKKKSVIFNWFISYFIFLIIFVILSFLIFVNTTRIIEREINNSNIFLLNGIQNDIDNTFVEARKISAEALLNTRMQKVLSFQKKLTDLDYYHVNTLLQDFRQYTATSKIIDNIYIMLKDIDKVVSYRGIEDTYSFYRLCYSDDKQNYEKWIKEYDEERVDKYSLVFTRLNNDMQHKLLYIRALSPINNRNLSSSITISIDENILINQLSAIDAINQGTSFILEGSTIITSAKAIKLPKNFNLNSDKGTDIIYTKINGESMVVSYITSKINDWKYVTVVPEAVFLNKVNKLKQITYIGILIALVLGIALIYYFLRANYNPINKLLNILSNETNINENDKSINEYDIIEKGLKKAIADKDTIAGQLKSQQKLLKLNFIEKLFKGSVQLEIPITEALAAFDIKFISNYFSVMLIHLEEGPDDNSSRKIDYNDICFIFANVVEELIGVHHKGFMVEIDSGLACLVNLREDRLSDAGYDLSAAVEEAQRFISSHFQLLFTVSISSVHESVDNIPLSYREALDTMNYKKVLGIKNTLFYENISRVSQGTFYYPIIKEQQLINIIKSGDYDNAKLILNEIYEVNFKTNEITPDLAQCLMLNLVSTIIRAVNEISPQFNDNLLEDLNPISRLLPCKSVEDMKHQLDMFLYSFCRYITKLTKSNSNWVSNEVIPFIEQNYQDSNLSVAQIAEKFDVHPVYLSKAFKDNVNSGLLDYIHKYRLEKCKYLMKENKDMSLEELGSLVGFTNARTLSRVFKKYEGVAPGKFKDAL